MNFAELEKIVRGLGAPTSELGIGRKRDDAFCVVEEDGKYLVFWYERGSEIDLCVYQSEAAACYGFLGLIGGMLRGNQPVEPRRGTTGSVGGAPFSDAAVQALVNGDIYGGLDESAWARQFVIAEDAVAAVGARRLIWPDSSVHPDGFATATGRTPIRLEPGRIVDSFGPTFSKLLYPAEVPVTARSLPIDYVSAGYRRWRVLTPTPVWAGPVAPWFGQPGGGEQFFTLMPIADLVGAGFVEEIEESASTAAIGGSGDVFDQSVTNQLATFSHVSVPETLVSEGEVREQTWCLVPAGKVRYEVFYYERGSRTEDLGWAGDRRAALRLLGGRLLYTDILNRATTS
ncbi:TNT domain-containing protein [Nocardia sp. NPDC050712]|uniref:TNT domain-containing protein n=1 Tax=Nocardia sp. NPDC050712 TaxID=3155518 RepID=UPI0033C43B88